MYQMYGLFPIETLEYCCLWYHSCFLLFSFGLPEFQSWIFKLEMSFRQISKKDRAFFFLRNFPWRGVEKVSFYVFLFVYLKVVFPSILYIYLFIFYFFFLPSREVFFFLVMESLTQKATDYTGFSFFPFYLLPSCPLKSENFPTKLFTQLLCKYTGKAIILLPHCL